MKNKFRLPIYADFLLTPRCNLKCSFCSASATKNTNKIKELSIEKIEKIFDEFDELELLRVGLEGGEPFLRDDIIDIMKIADNHDFDYFINTNGTFIDKNMAIDIGNTKVSKICVSIDGPNSKTHDLCRGVKGTFEKAVQAIKYLQEENVSVDAIFTLSKLNQEYIMDTLEFLSTIGIKNVAIMILASVGNAAENFNDVYLSYDEWKDILIKLTDLKLENKLPVDLNLVATGEGKCPWELYLPLVDEKMEEKLNVWLPEGRKSTLGDNEFGCTAGKDNFAIDGVGNVFGCSLMSAMKELSAGNINDRKLIDIWNDSEIFNSMRNSKLSDVTGECRNCDVLSRCKGGCRACAFSLNNSLIASDTRCPKAKGGILHENKNR